MNRFIFCTVVHVLRVIAFNYVRQMKYQVQESYVVTISIQSGAAYSFVKKAYQKNCPHQHLP